MKSVMRLAFFGLLFTGGAYAQSQGTPAWYVTSSTDKGATAMDVGRLERKEDVAVAMSALYFVVPQQGKDGPVDFIQTLDAYDCSVPSRTRTIIGEGYRVGQYEPVFKFRDDQAPWKTYGEKSPGMLAWLTACKGPNPQTLLPDLETHEQVLDLVRKQK